MNPLILALTLAAGIALVPARGLADPKAEAKPHLEAAALAYREQRYEDVLVALDKAYAADPQPELHYSIGQVYMKLGRCRDAIVAYEQFLSSNPTRERTAVANEAITACQAKLADQPEPAIEPTLPAEDLEPERDAIAPVVMPPSDRPPRWYQDKVGLALTGGGAAVTIVGLVVYASARNDIDAAGSAPSYQESVDLYDSARGKRVVSTVLVLGGLAATGIGAYRLYQRRGEERRLAIVPTSGGGLVTWSGGF